MKYDIKVICRSLFFHSLLLIIFLVDFNVSCFVLLLMAFFVRSFAITGGYHRYFAHNSYKTSRWFQFLLALVGTSTGQRGPLSWVSSHHDHHKHSDQQEDPHSPVTKHWFYAYYGWVHTKGALPTHKRYYSIYKKHPEIIFLNKHHYLGILTLVLILTVVSFVVPTLSLLQALFFGFILPTHLTLQATCLVNLLAHKIGKQRYDTSDNSRNILWLFPLSLGENLHNNHHMHPSSANCSRAFYEIDPTYWMIRLLEICGIVWDVRRHGSMGLNNNKV